MIASHAYGAVLHAAQRRCRLGAACYQAQEPENNTTLGFAGECGLLLPAKPPMEVDTGLFRPLGGNHACKNKHSHYQRLIRSWSAQKQN